MSSETGWNMLWESGLNLKDSIDARLLAYCLMIVSRLLDLVDIGFPSMDEKTNPVPLISFI